MGRPKKYPVELIARGVWLALESERPIAQIAAGLGMSSETLRRHVRRAEALTNCGAGTRSSGNLKDGPSRARTCDLGIKSPLLYQLSYRPSESPV